MATREYTDDVLVAVVATKLEMHEKYCDKRSSDLNMRLERGNERMHAIELEAKSLRKFVITTMIAVLCQVVFLLLTFTSWLVIYYVLPRIVI